MQNDGFQPATLSFLKWDGCDSGYVLSPLYSWITGRSQIAFNQFTWNSFKYQDFCVTGATLLVSFSCCPLLCKRSRDSLAWLILLDGFPLEGQEDFGSARAWARQWSAQLVIMLKGTSKTQTPSVSQLCQQHFLWEWKTLRLMCVGDHKCDYSWDLFWVWWKGLG